MPTATATASPAAALTGLHPIDRARVTTHAFTDLLRRQCGEDIVASVLQRDHLPASAVVARLLDVASGATIHRRKTLLVTANSRRPVTYAEAAIMLPRLNPEDQQAILDGHTPLGDVLHVAYADRVLLGWQVGGDSPPPDGAHLVPAGPPGSSLMHRLSLISHTQPVALVAEWWPTSVVGTS